ncbi:dynein heavy chain domain-containing protein 1 isoform X2 [Lepisosteus oculatus]|uniref:dynein heavy chain domain-containing protein 1 isoform X2 n=1 Tax=Lepisosteus oculatus TaxID=7918 RepID=UPI00371FC6D3
MAAHKKDKTQSQGSFFPSSSARLGYTGKRDSKIPFRNLYNTTPRSLPVNESRDTSSCPHLSPSCMSLPQLGGSLSARELAPIPALVSLAELPRLVSAVGPELALGEAIWREGPGLVAASLGVDIPINTKPGISKEAESTAAITLSKRIGGNTFATKDVRPTAKDVSPDGKPLKGIGVAELFMRNRHLGKLQFLHLNIASTCPYRPYDLHVVQKSKANPEHYVFSPSSVLHVQPNHSSDLTPLRDWHRESILWSALQKIPFFRNFLIRKTFTCWHRNVRQLRLHKRCESLQRFLLIAIPQFREALLQLSRLIEELKRVHWLPQDASQSYTLMEFQSTLCRKHQEARGLLEQFLHYRTLILLMVQEDSYRVFQKLQTQLEHFRLGLGREPLYLQVAQHRALEQNLEQAECVLQRLGSLASLTGHMIVHTMVTIIEREVTSFVNDVMKSGQPGRVSLFQAQLVFGTESQLTLFPPVTLFEETLSGALQSVANSALQVFDSFSYTEDIKGFLAASNSTVCAPRGPQEWSTSRGLGDTENELKDISPLKFPPKLDCGAAPDPGLVLSTLGPLRVRGQRLKAQYYPLSRCQLEWHLSLNPEVQEAEREQERMIKKALSEVQQFCKEHSWLSDIHHFISLWSPKCLEGLRGCTASQYDERIQVIRGWTDKVKTVPQKFTTTNKIMTVECIDVQKIEPVLCSIHGDILSLLTSEVEQRSETWMLELKRAVGTLRVANADFSAFAQYVSMVKCYQKMFYDLQQQLDYVHSLQETIRTNYRQLSKAEESMDEQMLDLWDSFVPLLQVATETVSTRLPSMVETLNSIYTSLSEELQGLVSTATTGQYLQPSQCAAVVLEELKGIAQQFQTVAGKLYDLNRTSQSLTGSPLDLSFIPSTERKLEARKGVWELLSQATMQINEWKRILFSKFVVAHAQEKVNDWLNQASLLVQTLPAQDNVFKETMQLIENFSQQLPLLLKLSSPTLKHKHWRHIFKGLGLMYETEWHLTVADLLPKSLLEYQNSITKVWQDAKAEADMEQAFRKLQRRWNVEQFRLANFIVKVWQEDPPPDRSKRPPSGRLHDVTRKQHYQDSGTFTIIGFENLLALAEDSVMTLSNMMLSPHISEFRQEVENWVHLLQELEELLGFWQRYQQEWVFLSKIFYETEVSIQKPELFCRFRTVDSNYRDMMQATSCSPRVLNIVRHGKKTGTPGQFQGQCLRSVFMEELSTMEKISNQLLFLLDSPRCEFPRLNFLSDGDVIKLLSLHPNHSALLPLVRKCFPSVKELVLKTLDQQHHTMTSMDLSDLQMSVIGVNGNLGEKLPFSSPLPSNYNLLAWLSDLEQRMREAVFRLLWDCIVARMTPAPVTQTETWNQYKRSSDSDEFNDPSWDLTSQFPLQCLLVAEEVLWCKEIQSSFLNQTVVKRTRLKARYATKLKGLIQIIQEHSLRYGESLDSQRVMSAFKALVLVAMKHCDLMSRFLEQKTEVESSFEWQKLLKYSLNSDPKRDQEDSDLLDSGLHAKLCYVDVLGSHIPYGYEYVGPDDWMIVNTPSSDRAVLGILLSLTSYRSSLVIGPSMSGKSKTVVHLGKVLGQQVVTLQYTREMSPSIVLQMLSGAIQTGAWLVLECVNVMTQGDLSLLGQYFSDIQRALTALQKNQQHIAEFQEQIQPHNETLQSSSSLLQNGIKEDFLTPPSGYILGCSQNPSEINNFTPVRISQTKPYEPQSFGLISFAGRTCLAKHGYGCVLIMSGSTSEIPENLRVATRPISLIQPDYLIIAEVSLAALGFSEAQSLAHRLVCLLTLAQKSLCLPQFINNCTSWLVVLKNIITTAGIHLHEHHLKGSKNIKKSSTKVIDHICEPNEQKDQTDLMWQPEEQKKVSKSLCSSNFRRSSISTLLLEAQDEEQAILKAISLVVVTAILDPEKVSHFQSLLEDIFSASPLQGTETDEIAILSSAVTQELQEIGLHSDQWTIKNVLSLYEALKLSRAVILVGPAGSGKTACYRTLVGALRKLAVKTEEEDYNEECMQSPESVTLKSKWSSVDTMFIFPNSVSEEEFSGICNHDEQHGGWWRAFTKILKDSERRDFSTRERQKSQTHKGKWVVLDGEPLAEGWMDQLSTLFDLEDPYLCFSSGQKVRPSPEQVKLLMEVTELASASPSTVTRCGIVYHSGKEVWKAIWKAELETLYREFSLDQTTLRLWNRLAEDLFSSTLSFLKHKALSPVLLEGSILSADKTTAHGVQEVMSFTRILHSFLEQYLIGKGKALLAGPRNINKTAESPSTTKLEDPGNLLSQKHLQAKNIFVVSYVWGFGGHLHPKYWLRFDAFARKSLYESWYSIEIPQEGTVYDYLINQNEGTLEMMNTGLLNSRIKTPPLSYSIPPQFEKYAYLLDVLLDSRQPALLVGETGAGKTTLSQSLLNYERPHVRLPITPCLRAADVRNVLENMWSPRAKLSAAGLSPAGSKQSCLFIDDLHHTTCDVGSKISSVLETLRQCMSKGGVLTSDGYHFKLLNSGAVSYLATCVSPECCSSMTICISPRFFRLFSVLTLPSLVTEHLLSIHSPRVLHWLKDLHITAVSQYTELASCIIGATVDLYSAVKENFPPHQQQPYLLFSYHDLQKVFQGMFLWTPRTTARQYPQGKTSSLGTDSALGFANISSTHGSLAAVLNITRLWIHECFRTFGDRLSSENEKRVLASLLNKVSQKYFCPKESDSQKTKGENESCAMPSENDQNSEKSEIILPLPDKDDQSEDIISSDSETCQVQSEGTVGDLTSVELPASSLKTETEEFVYSSEEESSASTITPIEPLESNLEICSDEDVKKIPAETCDKDNINTSSRDDERKSLYLKESFAKSLMTTTKSTFSDSVQSLILQPSPPKQGKHPRTADKNIKRRDNLGIYFKLSIVNEVPNQKITSFLLPIQLLQGVDAKDIIFSTNFCESLQSPTQQYSLKRSSVYQEKDMDLLIQQLSSLLQWQCREEMIDKGFVSGPESKLAIFRERVQQLTHILRVLLLPRGHAALFGMGKGTGRKTLVRFAVSFSGYRLYDVNPNNETEVSEILKEASDHAGVFGGRVVILVHEEVSQSVLDKLLAVMAEGTFPGLYNKDELSAAVQKITALTKNTKNRLGEEQVLERYYKHVQKNLHVFIMLSPKCQKHAEPLKEKMLSEIFLSRLLKLCSCVEMFQPLSAETLSEVAASRLQDVILPPEEEGKGEEACSLEVLTKSMATIHQSVLRYVTHQVPGLHLFSLQVFLEFTEHFRDIFTHLWQQARAQANRVATILRRLKILTNTAKQSSQEVLFVRNELKVAQELQQQLQREVDAQRILCEQTRQRCLQEENILSDLSEQLQQAQHESQEAFQQVSSLYQAALDALHSLTVADIEEIRCYRVPPDGVVMVMNAVCLMFGRPRNWESSKQLIGQTSFFQDLEFYDKSGITDSLFTALGRIVVQPEFQPAVVREASRACESLCLWLHSIYQYASVQRHLAPQHNRVHQVEEHMVKSRIRLGQERVQEEAARECLEELEKQYQGASQHVGELTLQLRHADAREREAHSAAQLMHSHITNWTAAAKKATEDNHNAVGDALVLAAAASYLGPFNPDVRLEMLEKWQELCHTGEMQLNPRDQRHEVLPTTVPPVPRNIVLIPVSKELPLSKALGGCVSASETFSHRPVLQLVIRRSRCPFVQRWPLLVGSAQQAKSCAEAILEEHLSHLDLESSSQPDTWMVLCADDPTLVEKIQKGAERGLVVLVTDVERVVLSPKLLDFLQRKPEKWASGLRTDSMAAHHHFTLFLSTHLPVRALAQELDSNILKVVNVIDISLSQSELEELLLKELVLSECPEVWGQRRTVQMEKLQIVNRMQEVEDSLVEYILQSLTPLLEDPCFLSHVSECQKTMSVLHQDLKEVSVELQHHCVLLKDFDGVVKLGSALYQALQEVSRLSPLYFFPLQPFLQLFKVALGHNGRTEGANGGEFTSATMAEITHRIVSDVLSHYRPCLFQSHARFFQLLVSVALIRHNDECTSLEQQIFLKGLKDVVSSLDLHSTSTHLVKWVDEHTMREICYLENLTAFKGLSSSLLHLSEQWQEYFKFPSSTVIGPVPCSSYAQLSTLQKAVLWKTLHPEWLFAVAEDLAYTQLGQTLASVDYATTEISSQLLNLPAIPVIFLLPQKGDLGPSTHPLYWIEQAVKTQANQVRIHVISFGSHCQRESTLHTLDTCTRGGHWLVFNNCHLLDQWDSELVSQLSKLFSQTARGKPVDPWKEDADDAAPAAPLACGERPIHPQFRLWFITRSDAPQSIPAAVKACALRLACDSPWELKETLCSSLRQAAAGPCPPADLQIRCAVLHSVLLQRQNYRQIAQGHLHCWTQEDLLAVLNAWEKIERLCEDPVQALEFIAGSLVYGGHAVDSEDLDVLQEVARSCLWGRGLHAPEIIGISGCYGASPRLAMLQDLEQRVQQLASSSVILGLSAGLVRELITDRSQILNSLLESQMSKLYVSDQPAAPDISQARERLQALRESMDRNEESRGARVHRPLQQFVQKEWDSIISVVSSMLSELSQSSGCNKTLSSWDSSQTLFLLHQLESQAKLLGAYLWEETPPAVYHLSAFQNPKGFLVAVLQEQARAEQRDISNFSLQYQVLKTSAIPSSPPHSGIYITGLELHGALWDTRLGAVQETLSIQPCQLPVVWVRATADITTATSSPSSFPLYLCPVYKDLIPGHLMDRDKITYIPLVAKLPPTLCKIRRVRIIIRQLTTDL